MLFYNLKDPSEQVSFVQATRRGLGRNQGLFFPQTLPRLDAEALLEMPFIERSAAVLAPFIADEIPFDDLLERVRAAFAFPAPLVPVQEDVYALSLFCGPTLAFKDFGARFLAQMMAQTAGSQPMTILTATSGDTGAAVAHAFWGIEGINVVVLYPRGRISPLQEKLFCTLGGNVTTVSVDGDFDACQALVKQAFDDEALRSRLGLNSANSINVSRLLAQICYYFEAVAQLPRSKQRDAVVCVPSGNFGNLTAGLMARAMGLPVKRFAAATNANDTVPRYVKSGVWDPHATIATISNSMDVSRPNNWPRVEELLRREGRSVSELFSESVSDEETRDAMRTLAHAGHVAEPHGAVAWRVLTDTLTEGETGIFLETAHPAKFQETVERTLGIDVPLPEALAKRAALPVLSQDIAADFGELSRVLKSI
ncbi:MAG: threonine synthase [Pyramidobacter sp.]|nr:threonine synthase [Pyramidobacter sp.]